MHWIKEVEMAKTSGEFMTSRSIVGRTDFTDFDMIDAMIASALKRLLDKHINFRKRVSVEEQGSQNVCQFLRGRQLLTCSTSISFQLELLKRHKDSQICSV